MRYIILFLLVIAILTSLSSCFDKTCSEQGGEIKAMAPVTYWQTDGKGFGHLQTIYPTECVK
jgi:uncharacterized protein YceK